MPLDAEDKRVLDEILVIIHKEIKLLVEERLSLFREEMQEHFPGPAWGEIAKSVLTPRGSKSNMTHSLGGTSNGQA